MQASNDIDTTDSNIQLAAHRLAIKFTEQANLPARFRKSLKGDLRKSKEDSKLEKRFKANVDSWRKLIDTMLVNLNHEQAWRFINHSPKVAPALSKLTDCQDFCKLMDYMILRRDQEQCGSDEVGGLALLSAALQREVEIVIQQRAN